MTLMAEFPGASAVVADVRSAVLPLTETLWAARPAQELVDVVTQIETLKSTLDSIELEVVAELEATDGAKVDGWASTRDFVTHVAGGFRGAGPAAVRLAEALDRPESTPVGQALTEGWLSRVKAEVIARAVEQLPGDPGLRARATQTMLEEARHLDASDLRRAGRHLVAVVDPDGDDRRTEAAMEAEERAAHDGRFLSFADDGAGGVRIKGRGTVEDAATIKAALIPLAAPAPSADPDCEQGNCAAGCAHDGRDPRDHGARMFDALVELGRQHLATDHLPETHGARPQVRVTIGYDELRAGIGEATTETGETLSATAVRRLACDADLIPIVLGTPGEVLDVGRVHRLVTPAIWRALTVRDAHCRFPGCRRLPLACDAHHIVSWLDGGPTSLPNLILLCRAHHTLIHRGPWRLDHDPDGRPVFHAPPRYPRRRQERLWRFRDPPDG